MSFTKYPNRVIVCFKLFIFMNRANLACVLIDVIDSVFIILFVANFYLLLLLL